MGEGVGNEAELMPFIHLANIACGYHAGNVAIMKEVSALCIRHGVHIGAHPSFPDKENFGRTPMRFPEPELYAMVADQLKLMNAIALECGGKLHHVKPHGALYNMATADPGIARVLTQAVKDFDPSLIFVGLSGSVMIAQARRIDLVTLSEVFADRTYQDDGSLTPRSQPNAILKDSEAMKRQVKKMVQEQKVQAVSGKEIPIVADTICIHGDGEHAVEFAKTIYKLVHAE